MVTDVKLGESSGEVIRVAREEVSMDTIQHIVDLYSINNDSYHFDG